jgi:tetratricopeptide (TPR) repeat protein
MLKKVNWVLAIFMVATIGCTSVNNTSTNKSPVPLNIELFEPVAAVISEQDLYLLTKAQERIFLDFYNQQINEGYLPHKAIRYFLESSLSNFTYYGKTYTASEAMSNNSGNCMSLAILTTAFSRLVGVEMDYRKMHSLPIYEKHGNVILSSSHVQSLLYEPNFVAEEDYFYINRPGIVIDYFPQEGNIRSKTIKANLFLAMYYVNKAAEFYIEKEYDDAFSYVREAYRLDTESTAAINLLALLHKKRGDEATAERLYLTAIESSDTNISVLDNYLDLLKSQGKFEKATKVKQRLENIYDPNPYHWLEKAQLARYQSEFTDAERYYRKVIKLAPYVKQAYLELHEVYLIQGKKSQAIVTLQQSLPWLHEPKQKQKYKKQLYQLSAI